MTKTILKTSLIIVFVFAIILISGCTKNNAEPDISAEEKEFNESGRAKAILDEKDLLHHYVNELQGKWVSIDDEDSIVEFKDDKKIDYYAEQLMSEHIFNVSGKNHLTVGEGENKLKYEIVEATSDSLTLIYLGRGNILEYKKIVE